MRPQRMAGDLADARAGGRRRHYRPGYAAGAGASAQFPALLRRAFHRHLSGVLPADGGNPDAAAAGRPDPRYRRDLAPRYPRRRRRRAGVVARGAGSRRQFPVRAPRRILDRAEKIARDIAGGGVVFAGASTTAVIARLDRAPRTPGTQCLNIDAPECWITRWSLSSGSRSRDPLAGDDGLYCGWVTPKNALQRLSIAAKIPKLRPCRKHQRKRFRNPLPSRRLRRATMSFWSTAPPIFSAPITRCRR